MPDQEVHLTPEQLLLVEATVKTTIGSLLGVNVDDPSELRELHLDMAAVRSARKLGGHAAVAAVTLVVGGMFSAIWLGLKATFSPH